jgi:hypothetical protein
MRYNIVSFRSQIRGPKHRLFDGASTREGYTITRNGDDVVVHHDEFGAEVVIVPWSNVAFAVASEDELTKPEKKR